MSIVFVSDVRVGSAHVGLGRFDVLVFGHPFVVAIEEDLSRSDRSALEPSGMVVEHERRFRFEKKLRLFNEWLHFI